MVDGILLGDGDGVPNLQGPPAVTADQLAKLLDGRAITRSNIPKVPIFLFKGERVSEWLELLEQVTNELTEGDKFKHVHKYVWWEIRPEVAKVATDANGSWTNFKKEMQRRHQLGDGLLTSEDLERLGRSDFTTVGAFATAFEKMAKRVPGLAEDTQCAIFLSNFSECEGVSLTKGGAAGQKLTWATIKKGLTEGDLDQVYQIQMKQQRQKRKAREAADGAGIDLKKVISEAIGQYQAAQQKDLGKRPMAIAQGEQEEEEEGEEGVQEVVRLTRAQRKARNAAMGGQGSGRGVGMQPAAQGQGPAGPNYQMPVPPPPGPWPGYHPAGFWPGQGPYGPWGGFNPMGQFPDFMRMPGVSGMGGGQQQMPPPQMSMPPVQVQPVPSPQAPPQQAPPLALPQAPPPLTILPPPQAAPGQPAQGGQNYGRGGGGRGNFGRGGRGQGYGSGGRGQGNNGGGRGQGNPNQGGQGQGRGGNGYDQGGQGSQGGTNQGNQGGYNPGNQGGFNPGYSGGQGGGNQGGGNQGYAGGQGNTGQGGYGRAKIDWRSATCPHCAQIGHTLLYCQVRKIDEAEGLISTNLDGDIYDCFGKHMDPTIPGGTRLEALKIASQGQRAPMTFRLWQEEEPAKGIKVEEVETNSEEPSGENVGIVEEEGEEDFTDCVESVKDILWRMEDIVGKLERLNLKMMTICEEAPKPMVFSLGPPNAGGGVRPAASGLGVGPRSGILQRAAPRGLPNAQQGTPLAQRGLPIPQRGRKAKEDAPTEQPSTGEDNQPEDTEPIQIEEDQEPEVDEDEKKRKEEEDQAASRAKKRKVGEKGEGSTKGKGVRKGKYQAPLEKGVDIVALVDRLLEGHNDLLNLKDILAAAPKLRDEFKSRLTRRKVACMKAGDLIPKEAHWSLAGTKMDWKSVATGNLNMVIKGKPCIGMLDTGAEMNIIKESDALRLGMGIDRTDSGFLYGATSRSPFVGTASNVVVEIGKVKVRSCFYVMPDLDHPILLGRSFLCRTESVIINKHDGTMFVILCDPVCGNHEVLTCHNTGPGNMRNKTNPGSFTFKESEAERERLTVVEEEEEQEEARPAEGLSLSLSHIGDAMEMVSIYGMADPEALEALREKVSETPDEGEERDIIRGMKEEAERGPCRISEEREDSLIIGEEGFLSPEERSLMVKVMRRGHRAYAFNDEERGRLDVDKISMIRIHTVPHVPWNVRGARYPNPEDERKVVSYLDAKMASHVADFSSGPYASPWFCFIKPNGTLRWVQDLQKLNAVTIRDAGGLPNADALSEACAGRAIVSLIDLYSGYDQFPIYPSDRPMTAMHTPRGLLHMNVAPQGWTNAVAMVQRHMVRATQTISPRLTQPYIDDLAVKGPRKKDEAEVMPGVRKFVWDHIEGIKEVLEVLEEYNLTASGPKSKHCMREVTILGFLCNEAGRRPDERKTNKILDWPVPFRTVKDVRSFLGTCGFWRIFIEHFAAKTEPLRKLVRKDQVWEWGEKQEVVVKELKEKFKEGGLVLGVPDFEGTDERPFIVETDAGPTALGGVLIQVGIDGRERPLRFESRTLNGPERNYSQFKRETLAVLHCLRIFRNYLFGRRFVLRVDPTALACSLANFAPSDPTIARWLTYVWMFDFELERIPGTKNRADGLSRINWDKEGGDAPEDTPPVDGFLEEDEDVKLHINSYALEVKGRVVRGASVWMAPDGYEVREDLVLKPFEEESSWGEKGIGWMAELALAETYRVADEPLAIESGTLSVEAHAAYVSNMSLLVNSLVGEDDKAEPRQTPVEDAEEGEFEVGEVTEAFRAAEYEGIYQELGLLLSCEIRERDASKQAIRMRNRFLVRDGHLFVRAGVLEPRRVVCGKQRQIDVIAALHDGVAGGHRSRAITFTKVHQLYYWDGMGKMIDRYCESCVPCQERSAITYKETLHPRITREVGAVVHLDLLAMPLGVGGYNYIFDARDNLSGFVDGRAIRSKTGETLAACISEYYLRYPFVVEFVMDRGSEFTCNEVRAQLSTYGVIARYTTRAHPQANAPVERGHSTITNILAKWVDGKENQWPKYLRAAFFVENVTIKRSTGFAPVTLWYGRHATFPIESFLKTWRRQDLESKLSFEELLDLRARQVKATEERVDNAVERITESRLQDKERWDRYPRVRKEPLKVGDVVLLYDSSLEKQWSRKLDKRWLGPYRIHRCGMYGAYELEELSGVGWRDWVSGSRLKKFNAREEEGQASGSGEKRSSGITSRW